MFADMVGYTALMQESEERARVQRDRHRAVLAAAVVRHRGRVLEHYGDGTLCLFDSAVEAVSCAVAVQDALATEDLIPLRIGVHTGDIVEEEEEIYGDGVNVASRIEGLAAPGGVMVSGKVFDEIKNHASLTAVAMGEVPLKNVTGTTPVYAIANEGLAVPSPGEVRTRAGVTPDAGGAGDPHTSVLTHGRRKALVYASVTILGLATSAILASLWSERGSELPEDYVAVFPFRNLTGDRELDDLGAAAAYLITDGLSRVDEVRGVATSTVEQTLARVGGAGAELEAAEVLGAGTAVMGVVTRRGDSIRLSAQITRVPSGEVLPGVEALGPAAEPLAAVDALGQQVLSALALASDTISGPFIGRPPSYEALRVAQRGFEIGVAGDPNTAREYFHRAYAMDSTFLTPLIWATGVHGMQGEWASADSLLAVLLPRRDEMSPAERLQVEFWTSEIAGDLEGDVRATRALAREDPRSWGGWHAETALLTGRPEEALRYLEGVDFAWESSSGWAPIWNHLVNANYAIGRYEEALDAARRGRSWFPRVPILAGHELRALVALGRADEIGPLLDTLEVMEPAWGESPGSVLTWTAGALHRHGHDEQARAVADRAVGWYRSQDPGAYPLERARALLLADRPEEALRLVRPPVEGGDDTVLAHGLHGVALALTGDEAGAEAEVRWCASLDRPYLRGEHTYWRAAILASLGRHEEATRLRRQAYREGQSYAVGVADADFRALWGYEPYERLLAPRG